MDSNGVKILPSLLSKDDGKDMGRPVKMMIHNYWGEVYNFITKEYRKDFADVWAGTKQAGPGTANPWTSLIEAEIKKYETDNQ